MTKILYGCAVPVICYSFYPLTSDALFSSDFEDLLYICTGVIQNELEYRNADIPALTAVMKTVSLKYIFGAKS